MAVHRNTVRCSTRGNGRDPRVSPAVDRFGVPNAPDRELPAFVKEVIFMVPFILLYMVEGTYVYRWCAIVIGGWCSRSDRTSGSSLVNFR